MYHVALCGSNSANGTIKWYYWKIWLTAHSKILRQKNSHTKILTYFYIISPNFLHFSLKSQHREPNTTAVGTTGDDTTAEENTAKLSKKVDSTYDAQMDTTALISITCTYRNIEFKS